MGTAGGARSRCQETPTSRSEHPGGRARFLFCGLNSSRLDYYLRLDDVRLIARLVIDGCNLR